MPCGSEFFCLRAQAVWIWAPYRQVRELELSAGERGCASSHIRAWRHCLEPLGTPPQPNAQDKADSQPATFDKCLYTFIYVYIYTRYILYILVKEETKAVEIYKAARPRAEKYKGFLKAWS